MPTWPRNATWCNCARHRSPNRHIWKTSDLLLIPTQILKKSGSLFGARPVATKRDLWCHPTHYSVNILAGSFRPGAWMPPQWVFDSVMRCRPLQRWAHLYLLDILRWSPRPLHVTPPYSYSFLLSPSRHPISMSILQLLPQRFWCEAKSLVPWQPPSSFLPHSQVQIWEVFNLSSPCNTNPGLPHSEKLFIRQASTHSSDWVCYLQPFNDIHRTTPTIVWFLTEAGLCYALLSLGFSCANWRVTVWALGTPLPRPRVSPCSPKDVFASPTDLSTLSLVF